MDRSICWLIRKQALLRPNRQFFFFTNSHIQKYVPYLLCCSLRLGSCSEIRVSPHEIRTPLSVRKVRGGGVREGGRDRVKVVAGWKFMTMRKWMQRERERERERERSK